MRMERVQEGRRKSRPWTVRDIPDETRELVTLAARHEGVTISHWVAETLQKEALASLRGKNADGEQEDYFEGMVMELLSSLRERVSEVESVSRHNRQRIGRLASNPG